MLPSQHTPAVISEPHQVAHWITVTGVALVVAILLTASFAWAEDADSSASSDEKGIQVAAWAVTVPYIIAKGAFAAGGAVVGGLGYLFSGLDERTAKAVWTRSIYGTYIIRPAHLRGEEAVRFLGPESENQDETMPASDHSSPEPIAPTSK